MRASSNTSKRKTCVLYYVCLLTVELSAPCSWRQLNVTYPCTIRHLPRDRSEIEKKKKKWLSVFMRLSNALMRLQSM